LNEACQWWLKATPSVFIHPYSTCQDDASNSNL
jgi:hypothetical protein